jgi:imidazolonepropionase-like amidohydrolase
MSREFPNFGVPSGKWDTPPSRKSAAPPLEGEDLAPSAISARACLFFVIALAGCYSTTPLLAQTRYIRTGALIDASSGHSLKNRCITIKAERITAVVKCTKPPKAAKVIDWRRYTVLPGLIDLHTHLADTGQSADVALPLKTSPAETVKIGAENARATLMAGFTTVRDVGTYRGLTDVMLRDSINRGDTVGPRMFVSGAYITIPGGGGELNGVIDNDKLPADMRLGVARTPDEAAQKTAFLLDSGADQIKMIATGAVLAIGTEPGTQELSETQMRAVVAVATQRGTYATAHAHGAEGIKSAIRAGVHSVEHASLIDDEGLALAKAKGIWLVMDIYDGDYIEEVGTREKWPAEYLRKNRETTDLQRAGFAKAVKLGVKLAFGTDAGVYPHGLNARQFSYMVKYGMTPMQAVQSATIRAAELMGKQAVLGNIARGRFADMIAVEGDPLNDIRRLETVAHVMKDGVLVK